MQPTQASSVQNPFSPATPPSRLLYIPAFLYTVVITLVVGWMVDITRLHEWMLLSDQAMYITAARSFLDTGKIEFTCQPVSVETEGKRQFYYMPGYCIILAASYAVFGYGVLQTVMPTALLFMLSCMLCYHLALKLYSPVAAWVALILFSSFPFLHHFTFVAMSEVPIIASMLLALTVFVHLTPRWQVLAGWALCGMVVLFRETSAVVIFPMCAILWKAAPVTHRWRSLLLFFVTSMIVMAAIYLSPLGTTRESLFYNLIVYENDPALSGAHELGTQQEPRRDVLLSKLVSRAGRQLVQLVREMRPDLRNLEWLFFLIPIPLGLVLYFRRSDSFMLSIVVCLLLTLAAIVSVYVLGHIGKRHFLQLLPLVCILYGQVLSLVTPPRWSKQMLGLLLLVVVPASMWMVHRDWRAYHQADAYCDQMLRELESVRHDDTTAMLAPNQAAVSYGIVHYPVRVWALPYSLPELKTILAKHPVKTLLLPVSGPATPPESTQLTRENVQGEGFQFLRTIEAEGNRYDVFLKR